MTNDIAILESQLRECYGRVVYTHKTHEKCADILLTRHNRIKLLQIALSALVTGGIFAILSNIFETASAVISAILSTALLVLNSYTKDYDLGEIAQKHRQAATDIWLIREKYLSLITDLLANTISVEDARDIRDNILSELHTAYTGAPSTNFEAYQKAQTALQNMEEMTFSNAEIDKFLPNELRRNKTP